MAADWIESAIGALSPRWALRRAQARYLLGELRAYDAARVGRRTEGWIAGGGSANAEIGFGLARIRNRARDMVRNNEYAVAAINGLVSNLVGTGILSIPADRSEARLWDEWASSLDCDYDGVTNWYGLQRLVAHAWMESGECLVRRMYGPRDGGAAVPLQLRVYEPDHLDESRSGVMEGGNVAILGVEFDRRGRRVAYWLYPEHPGESAFVAARGNLQSVRVPASEVLHVYDRTRPSQVRGVSRLAVSIMRARSLADYEDAVLMRRKIEACVGLIVTTDSDSMVAGELVKLQQDRDIKGEKIYPGMIKYIRPGEAVESLNPTPTVDTEWSRRQLHAIAVGCGVPYPLLTGDMSQANFSSNRMGLMHFRQLLDQLQWLVLVPQLVQPVRRWWREAARDAGRRVGAGPDKITMPKRQPVDPLKDVLAAKAMVRGGLQTRSEFIREFGFDPDEVRAEFAAERSADAAAGLVFDTDAAVSELKSVDPQAAAESAAAEK